jgi:hypothetical protein
MKEGRKDGRRRVDGRKERRTMEEGRKEEGRKGGRKEGR